MQDDRYHENRNIALILERTSHHDKRALLAWLDEVIDIRNSPMRKRDKIKKIILSLTHSSKIIPILKSLKPLFWDNRSSTFKIGVGITAATAMFMPVNVGIATAGFGIGIPLWVLSGSGYYILSNLRAELRDHLNKVSPDEIIDAEYIVMPDEKDRA